MNPASYKRVPEGDDVILLIKKVEFKPQVNPEQIITTYEAENGATISEYTKINNEVSMNIFRTKFDIITNNVYANETEFNESDIARAMSGRYVSCVIKDEEYNGKKYPRLKKINSVIDGFTDVSSTVDEDDIIPF